MHWDDFINYHTVQLSIDLSAYSLDFIKLFFQNGIVFRFNMEPNNYKDFIVMI